MKIEEDQIILNEITEELKHDQFVRFVKRYQTPISILVLGSIAGIVMYTSWKNRVSKELEDTTYGLMEVLASGSNKSDIILTSMAENAPASIQPMVEIIKAGIVIRTEKDAQKRRAVLDDLLKLADANGVDTVWKDLATLVYVSNIVPNKDNIAALEKRLHPITDEGRPFRLSAFEVIGCMYMNLGNYSKANFYFDQILKNNAATKAMKDRIGLFKGQLSK